MKLTKFIMPGLAIVALGITGCSKDKSDDPNKNPEGPGGSGTMEAYTPEQSKEYLTETATEFLDLFKPTEQEEVIKLASYFEDEYGDYDMPANFGFDDDDEDYNYAPQEYLRSLSSAMRGNLDDLTRAAYVYTYNINFEHFAGKYEPRRNTREWAMTSSSNDIIFAFTDANSRPCELRITKEGNTSDLTVTVDEDYYYDTEEYIYNISIPHTVKAELKQDGKLLASSTVTSKIDINAHTLEADVTAEVANLKMTASVRGTDEKLAYSSNFYINGDSKCNSYATINGRDLCNKSKIQNLIENEFDKNILGTMLTNGDAGVNVLDKVQVYAQISYNPEIIDLLDQDWYYRDYSSKVEAENSCKYACTKLNGYITAQLRYNNTKTDQATLQFQPGLDIWNSGESWEYFIEPVILFPQDNSTMTFEDYFRNFNRVENKWNVLTDAYEKIWENARP